MYKKIHIGRYQFHWGVSKLQWVDGTCSDLKNGKHILMWDFDEKSEEVATIALLNVQHRFKLPKIYLMKSSEPDNWIAYCFKALDWQNAFGIVALTEAVDWQFVKHSSARNYFTLRIGKKRGQEPKLFTILPSDVREDCKVDDLARFVKYQTRADSKNAMGV